MKFKKTMVIGLSSMMILGCFGGNGKAEKKEIGLFNYIAGDDRVETSIKTSRYSDSKTLVLASAYNFADALSSYNIVASKNAKLILVGENTDIEDLMRSQGIEKVYLIGGENILKGKPVADAKMVVRDVQRIAGADRYETNKATLKVSDYDEVGVADGRNFPDALSASALLKSEGLGLKLVNGSKDYKTDKTVKYTFGYSVRQNNGTRIAGKDRYETNERINLKLADNPNNIITYGGNYADALSSANLLTDDNKIVLLNNKTISEYSAKAIENGENTLVGGLLKNLESDILKASIGQYKPAQQNPNQNVNPPQNKDFNFDFYGPVKTQNDLDKYILTRYTRGIGQSGETVKLENPDLKDVSPFVKVLIEDTGYLLYTYKERNKFTYSLGNTPFLNSRYDRDDFINNVRFVRENLAKSGALDKNKSTYDRYVDSIMYMKLNSNYFKDDSLNAKISSSSPNSLYLHNGASCMGYTYYTNMAALLMQIPSHSAIGRTRTGYHAENIFIDDDGQKIQINSTGVTNPEKYGISSIRGTLDPTVIEYYIDDYTSKDYEFHKIRERYITRDIYKNLNN